MSDLKCAICGGDVGPEDFCYGCREYICDGCDNCPPAIEHTLDDHKAQEFAMSEKLKPCPFCRYSDAWVCAEYDELTTLRCSCECHKYVEQEIQ